MLWAESESWLSEGLQYKCTFNTSIRIFIDMVYDGALRYPMGWTVLFSSIILKKSLLKNWKSNEPPLLIQWMNKMHYFFNMKKIWATERNRIVQFEVIWYRVLPALEIEAVGTCRSEHV